MKLIPTSKFETIGLIKGIQVVPNDMAIPQQDGNAVYDFDLNDFGMQPDYDKDYLAGKVIYCYGVSESTFDGSYQSSARSLLHNIAGDATGMVYGCLLAESSPAIKQAMQMQEKGKTPFLARLVRVDSKVKGHNPYWTFERYLAQYDSDGNMIDPNSQPTAAPTKKGN